MNDDDTPPKKFTPLMGRKDRQFDRMWQAVQYAIGYSASSMGVAQPTAYANQWYDLGRKDEIADQQKPPVSVELAVWRKANIKGQGQTFDEMLDGVCK